MTPLEGLGGFLRARGGLWQFLIARNAGRAALALERERNAATAAALLLLPPGGELLEHEHNGRLRAIRVPQAQPNSLVDSDDPLPGRAGRLP